MGVKVGAIDKIEPAGDKMKVTFHYANKYKVPADAQAVILNPTLVASRLLQLEPVYKGGPVLADNAVIPEERTQVPTDWDELRNTVTNVISKLGPQRSSPRGRSVRSSIPLPTAWPARASRSTPPSTTCRER